MLGQLLLLAISSSLSQLSLPSHSSEHPKGRCSHQFWTLLAVRPVRMKTQSQSTCMALWLNANEATLWCLLGFQI